MPNKEISFVFFGDIIGRPGRETCEALIENIKEKYSPDLIIANGENLAAGFGISRKVAKSLFDSGVDIFTGGNHILHVDNIEEWFETEKRIIIPANFTHFIKGNRLGEVEINGRKIYIISIVGQMFMASYDNPFIAIENLIKKNKLENSIIIVDFHAEATSEKRAMFHFLDGKVTAILGTHTHIPTADGFVSNKGTAYITDVGMVGSFDSVIGMDYRASVNIMHTGRRDKIKPCSTKKRRLDGVFVKISAFSKEAVEFERFTEYYDKEI